MRVRVELLPKEGQGTHLVYEVWALPRSLLGVLGIPLQIGQISAKRFDSIFREYDRLALDGRRAPDPSAGRKLTRGGWSRLQRIREDLLSQLGEA